MKNTINIVPYPYSVTKAEGSFVAEGTSLYFDKEFKATVKQGIIEFFNEAGYSIEFTDTKVQGTSTKNCINLVTSTSQEQKDLTCNDSYLLKVKQEGISLYASSNSGFFYGLVTLVQFFMQSNEIQVCTIYDKSRYQWRGFLLDTCRSFYSTDFVKKIIRVCSFHKLNVFHWHLTDDQGWRVPVQKYPLLIEKGTPRKAHTSPESLEGEYDSSKFAKFYYTHEEIKEIVEYAASFNMEIVPEVEFPGHASALLAAYPEFGCTKHDYVVENRWGIFDDVLCLGNDSIFDLMDATLEEFTKLFPGKYIHIGGDECPSIRWKNCPDCQKRIQQEGLKNENQLQSWGTKRMTDLVIKHGKTPIGWDEVIDNTETIPLSKDVIVQSWRGKEGGEKASKAGHKVIMSPHNYCYLNYKEKDSVDEPGRLGLIPLEKAYSFDPVTENMEEKAKEFVLGGECALWTEELKYSRIAEYLMFPRLCALSEGFWLSQEQKDWNRFTDVIKEHGKSLKKLDFLIK